MFDSVKTNTSSTHFRDAYSYLRQEEVPYAWISFKSDGMGSRCLVTNWRILIFGLEENDDSDIEEVDDFSELLELVLEREVDIVSIEEISLGHEYVFGRYFDIQLKLEKESLELKKIPTSLAEQVSKWVEEQRNLLDEREHDQNDQAKNAETGTAKSMLSLKQLGSILGFSKNQVRTRFDLLKPWFDQFIQRGENNKILINSKGLGVLRKFKRLEGEKDSLKEVANKIKQDSKKETTSATESEEKSDTTSETTSGRISDLVNSYEDEDSEELKRRYREKRDTRDMDEYTQDQISAINQVLTERGESIATEKFDHKSRKRSGRTSKNSGEGYKHKIISGPVLGGQDELENKLKRLGKRGWKLIDTQRHSIMSKQHAVCFLRKDEAEEVNKLGNIVDRLDRILDLLEDDPGEEEEEAG